MKEDYDLLAWFQEEQEIEYIIFDSGPYEGYKVGSDGTVWTLWRSNGNGHVRWKDTDYKLVEQRTGKGGYTYAMINCKNIKVHQLILFAFEGPCPDGLECLHKDGDPKNNAKYNLKYGTHLENSHDSLKHGTFPVGESNGRSVLREEHVLLIRKWKEQGCKRKVIVKLIKEFDGTIISIQQVDNVTSGRSWKSI